MNKSALVLFSGGLDSLLTINILISQWIDVTALTYETPFFGADKAKDLAKFYWFKHIIKDISEPHLWIVINPEHWYWKNMNPCIDCHGFMFKIAGSIADQMDISMLASWEVLGQRPFSQNKQALWTVRIIAWRDILRPLSAKLLPETIYEVKWLVSRDRLYDFEWKSRKNQMTLANKFWLTKYTAPWWWCILTTIEYSQKLKNTISKFGSKISPQDAVLIRHWRINIFETWDNCFLWIMWKNQSDNNFLDEYFALLNEQYIMYHFVDISWPRVIINTYWNKIDDLLEDKIIEWISSRTKERGNKIKITHCWKIKEKNII